MSDYYTDDDVKAVAAVIKLALDYRYTDPADIAASVLHTVAAAIAARALREAADVPLGVGTLSKTWLRSRADEIERT